MKNKYLINKNAISIMGGICFILFALVTLFSANTPFSFLNNLITHSFGFVGFWLLLPFIFILGVYLISNKRLAKIRFGTKLWGAFIIIICLLILTSHWGSWGAVVDDIEITGSGVTESGTAKYLTFSNAIPVFNEINKANPSVVFPNPKLGGGKIGYILAGALNSAITPFGLNFVCWVLIAGGLIMIFNRQVKKLYSFLRHYKRKDKSTSFKEVTLSMDENEPEQPIKAIETTKEEPPVYDNRPMYESFNASHPINNEYDLKKARFNFATENNQPVETYNEEISKPFFDTNKPSVPPIENNVTSTNEENGIKFEPEVAKKEYSEPFFEPLNDLEKAKEAEEKAKQAQAEPEVDFLHKPQPKANLVKNYIYPSIELLNKNSGDGDNSQNEASCQERTEIINKTLKNLGVGAEIVSHTIGPSVTRFDLKTNDDFSINGFNKYLNDISVRLNGVPVRFEPIVAGKSTSGLEVQNEVRTNVTLREAVEGLPYGPKHNLDIPFGKSISGELKFANLADFPHLLIAGTTGSGKSIFVHATIISLLMRNRPEERKLVMVDPKKVEMNYYDDIPHLLCPVISDLRKVLVCFNKLVDEMERRYTLFQTNKVRDIKGFNEFAKTQGLQPLPYIVVFIDEYADLIETCKEVRDPVVRIVQKARAAGIHMVFATQRPSVNVIDGVIKANVATRVALMCASAVDSGTVIGSGGAESLLGNGDMLVDCPLLSKSMKVRVQGCYVSEKEILRVCDFLREHYQPQFDPMFLNLEPVVEEKSSFDDVDVAPIDKGKSDEEAYQKIKEDAKHREYLSISYIVRTYGMGFSRAGKMFNRLRNEGVVAPSGDARGCKVLIYSPYSQEVTSEEQSTFIPDSEN